MKPQRRAQLQELGELAIKAAIVVWFVSAVVTPWVLLWKNV